jgi:putative transcriptional regulator
MKNMRMKIARIEKEMSQESLAAEVGVTRQTISLIESGDYNPSLKLCVSICKTLGKTLNDLFWKDDENA